MKEVEKLMKEILDIKSKLTQDQVLVHNTQTDKEYEVKSDTAKKGLQDGYYTIPDKSKRKNKNLVKPQVGDLKKYSKKTSTGEKAQNSNEVAIKQTYRTSSDQVVYFSKILENGKKYISDNENKFSQGDKERYQIFVNSLNILMDNSKGKAEKCQALKTLVQNNMIGTNNVDFSPKSNRKVYFTDVITDMFPSKIIGGLPSYKSITKSGNPNAFTNSLTLFAYENEIDIPIFKGGFAKAQGQYNEVQTLVLLAKKLNLSVDPKLVQKAQKQADLVKQKAGIAKYDKIEKCNQQAADAIFEQLDGKKVTRVLQVGALGKKALLDMGIDDKVDPTDIIVYYEDQNGNEVAMKISMKIYKNINAITVKGAGIKTAAEYYLGQQAKYIDQKVYPELLKKYNYAQPDISNDEKAKRFKNFRQQYMKAYEKQMVKLLKSEEGQQTLLKMWRQVHGCGTNTFTCISNVGKGTATLHKPNYYCQPKMPFNIEYKGSKIAIEFSQKGQQYLQMQVARSTNWKTSSLKFVHRQRKLKDSNAAPSKKNKRTKVNERYIIKTLYSIIKEQKVDLIK